MRITFFSLFVCLMATPFLEAKNASNLNVLPSPPTYKGLPCELPPPLGFHVEEAGATWIKFAWMLGNAQNQHRIRTYRSSDNLLLNTTIVPAGNFDATITNLPMGTDVYATINTICEDGSNGTESLPVEYRTLILDLIANGFQPGYQSYCTMNTNPNFGFINMRCNFSGGGSVTAFRITNGTTMRQFGVLYNNLTDSYQVTTSTNGNTGETIKIFALNNFNQLQNPPYYGTPKYIVRYQPNQNTESTIAEFDLLSGTGTNKTFRCLTLSNDFRIERLTPEPQGFTSGPGTSDRNENLRYNSQPATISPNPFNDQLDVFLSPTAEKVQLQLYNFSGQKVLDQQFSGGSEVYSLSTATLATGFYLLRIDADGDVQTLKVIKSE